MRLCGRSKNKPTPTPFDWYCPECRESAMKEAKRKAHQRWVNKRNPYKKTYEYNKDDGVEAFKPQPKPIAKLSPASRRWARMNWLELTKELDYYGITYPQSQIMKENNTLPEEFGLKRKKAKKCPR